MARIVGVDLPARKRAEIGLTYIYGIGRTRSLSILHRCEIDAAKKISDLTEEEVNKIRLLLESEGSIEGDLRVYHQGAVLLSQPPYRIAIVVHCSPHDITTVKLNIEGCHQHQSL